MADEIEIHKRLGLSMERVDEICGEIHDVFKTNRLLHDAVEFVNGRYDSESVAAGVMLNIIFVEPRHEDMKSIPFTDDEHRELTAIKEMSGLSWHDFLIDAAKDWLQSEKEDNPSRFEDD